MSAPPFAAAAVAAQADASHLNQSAPGNSNVNQLEGKGGFRLEYPADWLVAFVSLHFAMLAPPLAEVQDGWVNKAHLVIVMQWVKAHVAALVIVRNRSDNIQQAF